VFYRSHFPQTPWRNYPVEQGGIGVFEIHVRTWIMLLAKAYGIESEGGDSYYAVLRCVLSFVIDQKSIVRSQVVND